MSLVEDDLLDGAQLDGEDPFESSPLAWPDVPRTAFGFGQDAHLNACVDWMLQHHGASLTGYAHGYREAATAAYRAAASAGGPSPDVLVFPIAFLWRHHIELMLKEIISLGRVIGGEAHGFPAHHNIAKLWLEAKPFIASCGPEGAPEMKNVEAQIKELMTIDPASDGFRYPTGRDLVSQNLASVPALVNLRRLHEAMEAVANFFFGVSAELGSRRHYILEILAEGG